MPPKKPPPKKPGAAGSPRAPPAKVSGKKSMLPSTAAQKSALFAAFEALVQIHPTEAKERLVVADEEAGSYREIMRSEIEEHLSISEGESRELIGRSEGYESAELLVLEATEKQRIVAAHLAKRSTAERKASITESGLDPRTLRRKSRMDAELVAEEARLNREASLVTVDVKKAQTSADRDKWLVDLEQVRQQLEVAKCESDLFDVKHPEGKKIEPKKIADRRKELHDKCSALDQRIKKLEEMEERYQQREAQERERQRRCSVLRVDKEVITGNKSVLQKAAAIEIKRIQDAQNEILDEGLFRKMVMEHGDDFYDELKEHEAVVKRQASELKALHGPAPPHPVPPRRSGRGGKGPGSYRGQQEGDATGEAKLPPIKTSPSSPRGHT